MSGAEVEYSYGSTIETKYGSSIETMVNQPLNTDCIANKSASNILMRRHSNLKRSSSQVPPPSSPKTTKKRFFLLVFISGVFAAFILSLLSDYFKASLKKSSSLADISDLILSIESSHTHPYFSTQVVKLDKEDTFVSSSDSKYAEALNSLNAALEMKRNHKEDKALRLFQHAIALAPKHPSVLNNYGEFLEEKREDLMQADHMFVRALTFSPVNSDEHIRALDNRKRTAGKVDAMDNLVLQRIDKKKRNFQKIAPSSAALKRAKKEAYYQYVFHTVGIEGNTMSLAQTRSILETKLAVSGKSIMEHNEILGLDAALKFINQTLVDKIGDITLHDILEIHRRVIGNVDPIEAGLFRRTQVYVGDHTPPPPTLVELLVDKLVTWFNSYSALALHPVRLAALAHYKLVWIHPFNDGNGRTSRLLMNLVLMQAGFPPVIIRQRDRELYYKYLSTANEGDVRPFIRFIAECTERTLDAYMWATQEYEIKPLDKLDNIELPVNIVEHPLDITYNDLHDFRGPDLHDFRGPDVIIEDVDKDRVQHSLPYEHSDTIFLGPIGSTENYSDNTL